MSPVTTYVGRLAEYDLDLMLEVHEDGVFKVAARPGIDQTQDTWPPTVPLTREALS